MDNEPFTNPFDKDDKNKGSSVQLTAWIILGAIAVGCCTLSISAMLLTQLNLNSIVEQYFLPQTPGPDLTAEASQATAISARDQWDISVSDTFDDNGDNRWYVGTDDNQYLKITYEVKDGKYRWHATAHQGFIQWIIISEKTFADFYITVEARETGNANMGDYGILFREDKFNNYYYFAVSNQGEFMVLLNYQGAWSTLLGPIASPFIQTKEPNHLAIMGDGAHLVFFINDHYVGEITDNHIAEGKIGFATQLFEADHQSVIEFDNVEIRTPPLPATATPTIRPTPTITSTPTLTLTPHALIPAPENAEVFNETFDSNANRWDSFYSANTTVIQDGKLFLKSDNDGYIALAVCNGCPGFEERFYFQAEVIPEKIFYSEHGIAFCSEGYTHYVFAINSVNQIYSVYKKLPADWEIVFSNVQSKVINRYPVSNTLAVEYDQGQMKLYINGNLVNTYTDSDPPSACKAFGVYIDDGPLNLIADNVYAYEIKGTPVSTLTPTP